jgi:hypothetical protein
MDPIHQLGLAPDGFGRRALPRAETAKIVVLVMAVAIVLAISAVVVMRPSQQSASIAPTTYQSDVVDGWLPGLSAANAARQEVHLRELTDGWAPALTASQDAEFERLSRVTDGWAASLLK